MKAVSRRRFLRLSAAAGGAALVAACAPATAPIVPDAPARPIRGGTVRVGVQSSGNSDYAGGRNIARAMYNSLIRSDQKGNLTGELAESWQISDPQTYVFRLRQGVKFHDGTDFDAEAVKFNIERIQNPATKAVSPSDWTGIASVDVIDKHTARFRLKAPDTTLLGRLSGKAGYFASPTAVQKWGQDFGLHGVGTGPFQLVEMQPDVSITLKRFDGYWEKDERGAALPYLDGMVFRTMADATTRFNALRGGELDYVDELLPNDLAILKNQPQLTHVEAPGPQKWMWMHGGKAPFNNKSLRQAVAWGIDYEAIHKAVFAGTGSVGKYLYGPLNTYFDQTAPFYSLDRAKVKQKLAEGGQPNGFKFTAHVANVVLDQQIAQAVKGQLAEHGIEVTLQVLQTQGLLNERRMTGDFEASFSQFSPYPDANDTLYSYLRSGVPNNFPRYKNARVDELLDKAKADLNNESRKTTYHEIQRLVVDDAPIIFLHHDSKITGLAKEVQGYIPTVDTWLGFTERLWIKK